MGALGEVDGCQIALFGQAWHNKVDCCIVMMILHAKNYLRGSIFDASRQSNTSFGNVVACAVHANVQLRCQSWEYAIGSLHNIDPPSDFRLMC